MKLVMNVSELKEWRWNLQIEECELAWTASELVHESRCKIAAKDSAQVVIGNL